MRMARTEGSVMGKGVLSEVPYILHYPSVGGAVSDCLRISFQSGVELWISNVIRALSCQEIPAEIPELVFRMYHRMYSMLAMQ